MRKLTILIILILFLSGCQKSENENLQNNNKIKSEINEQPTCTDTREDHELSGIDDSYISKTDENDESEKIIYDFIFIASNNKIINVSDLDKQSISIATDELLEAVINLKDIKKYANIYNICPSGEYILLRLPREIKKYLEYEIELDISKDIIGETKEWYQVCYSIKDKKVVPFSEVKNKADIEFIFDTLLSHQNYYYVSSIDKITKVEFDENEMYARNYQNDLMLISENRYSEGKSRHIKIYDLIDESIISDIEIKLDEDVHYFRVSQWTKDGLILFTINHTSYIYDSVKGEVTILGENIYDPIITSDGKYLIYFIGPCPMWMENRILYDLHGPYEGSIGLYAKNLQTNEVFVLDEEMEANNISYSYSMHMTTYLDYESYLNKK